MIAAPDRTVCQLTAAVADLEESLQARVPCGGIKDLRTRRTCDRPAELRGRGHGCPNSQQDQYDFKCVACWRVWRNNIVEMLQAHGAICCHDCDRNFDSVESFNYFGPF